MKASKMARCFELVALLESTAAADECANYVVHLCAYVSVATRNKSRIGNVPGSNVAKLV